MILAAIGISFAWACGAIVVFRIGRWITTPLLRKLGLYRYYSPMFFTQPFGRCRLELHLGTTWDFFSQRRVSQHVLMAHLGTGMKGLITAIKNGEVDQKTKLRGTMYFLSNTTLESLGFSVRRPLPLEYIAFAANYIELCLLSSIVKHRISFVDIRRVRMINATAADLVAHEGEMLRLTRRFVS